MTDNPYRTFDHEELDREKHRILCIDSQRELLPFEEAQLQAALQEQRRRKEEGDG